MDSTDLAWLPWMLQTADSLFPTGAYAHSLGFEQSVQLGDRDLAVYLRERVVPSLRAWELPYVRFVHDAAQDGNVDCLFALDAEIGAAKLARETREASAQLGRRRLTGLQTLRPDDPLLKRCGNAGLACHHITAHGLQAVVLGAPLAAALLTYYYQSAAAVGAAAMKLLRIGQDGVQRALTEVNGGAQAAVFASLKVKREDAGWFDPLLEIASMRHERAGERLFIS